MLLGHLYVLAHTPPVARQEASFALRSFAGSFDSPSPRARRGSDSLRMTREKREGAYPCPSVSANNFVSSEIIPSTPHSAARSICLRSLTVQVITVLPAA